MSEALAALLRWPLLAALLAWLGLAASPGLAGLPTLCGSLLGSGLAAANPELLLALNPPGAILLAAALMTAAMMLPLQLGALGHIANRALRHGWLAQALFAASFTTVWIALLVPLTVLAWLAELALPEALRLAIGLVLVVLWQERPAKRRALGRCHARPPLGATPAALLRDALVFGAAMARWCAQASGPAMLLCLLIGGLPAMLAITLLLGYENFVSGRPIRLSRLVARRWSGPQLNFDTNAAM